MKQIAGVLVKTHLFCINYIDKHIGHARMSHLNEVATLLIPSTCQFLSIL